MGVFITAIIKDLKLSMSGPLSGPPLQLLSQERMCDVHVHVVLQPLLRVSDLKKVSIPNWVLKKKKNNNLQHIWQYIYITWEK